MPLLSKKTAPAEAVKDAIKDAAESAAVDYAVTKVRKAAASPRAPWVALAVLAGVGVVASAWQACRAED